MKQLIISIGRESGSGGHEIAEKLSARFDLPLYDKNLLSEIAKEKNMDEDYLRKYEESPRSRIFGRSVRGLNNSMEAGVFELQASWMRGHAKKGESFVIVGRCAESVLADQEALISFFITGEPETRTARLQIRHGFSQFEAESYRVRQDKRRKAYHDENCTIGWGVASGYDLTINSTALGIDGTVDMLEHYIRARLEE